MTRYLMIRSGQNLVVLFLFVSLVFLLVQAQPGDYSTNFTLDPRISPEARAELRRSFGLDRPVYVQYAFYLRNFIRGDLGTSFRNQRPVIDVLLERLPRTVLLFGTGQVASFYLGFMLGKIIAWRSGRFIDHASTIGGIFLFTVFAPWLCLMVLWLFGLQLGWFPLGKFINPVIWQDAPHNANYVFIRMLWTVAVAAGVSAASFTLLTRNRIRKRTATLLVLAIVVTAGAWLWWSTSGLAVFAWDILKHLVLPVSVITAIGFAGSMLLTRTSMLEVLREDFVHAARARGLPDKIVRDRYVVRNAMLPIATALIFSLPAAVDGSVIIETVFSWPGLGLTLVESAQTNDLPLAVGAILFVGVLSLVAHVLADVAYAFLDPRIRYE